MDERACFSQAYLWVVSCDKQSQIIGHRETVAVFCFYSSYGRKPEPMQTYYCRIFALICRFKWQ